MKETVLASGVIKVHINSPTGRIVDIARGKPYRRAFVADPRLAIVTPSRSPAIADAPSLPSIVPPDNQDHVGRCIRFAVGEHVSERSVSPVSRIDRSGDRTKEIDVSLE